MGLKSSFREDLKKEKQLHSLLDGCYHYALKNYTFKRLQDIKNQLAGIDLVFINKNTEATFNIDEKAQLDYINEDLPTFAFEIQYQKKGTIKKGWLFDENKKTDFYALITAVFSDEPNLFTSCKITLVNRKKLHSLLEKKGINENLLSTYIKKNKEFKGKLKLKELDDKNEGYLFFSASRKAEKPVNLILKLSFLLEEKVSKRLC